MLDNREIMQKQTGFTLLEIIIALALGIIVIGTTLGVYVTTVGSSTKTINSSRLNHDLESVMSLMVNDIKRAGYWAGATVDIDSRDNPFTVDDAILDIHTNLQIPNNGCILYTYDADDDGAVDDNEYYGFKLENNSIKIRKAGTVASDDSCNTANQWDEFIDSNQLSITTLQFSFTAVAGILPATSRCMNVTTNTPTNAATCVADVTCTAANPCNVAENRIVNIRLEGELISDNGIKQIINNSVEVRNIRIHTQF